MKISVPFTALQLVGDRTKIEMNCICGQPIKREDIELFVRTKGNNTRTNLSFECSNCTYVTENSEWGEITDDKEIIESIFDNVDQNLKNNV